MIRSHVVSTSSTSTSGWECNFQLGDKVLPIDSYVRTWRSGLGGQVSDSLGKALLLPVDLDHYADCRDKDIFLKLKWHTIAVSVYLLPIVILLLLLYLYILQFYKC